MAAATGVHKSGEIAGFQSSEPSKTSSNENANAQIVKGEADEEWPSAVIAPKSNQPQTNKFTQQRRKSKCIITSK